MSALDSIASALFLVASVSIYFSLLRQIGNRPPDISATRRFGLPEAVLALALVTIFLLPIFNAPRSGAVRLDTRDIIGTAAIELGIVGFIAVFLRLRDFRLTQLTGMARVSFRRVFLNAFVLMIVAYPLVALADRITARALGSSASSRQSIVELFSGSESLGQRVLIIALAVAVAPVAEEFIFRFFLYGVLRRYAGRAVALVISAGLFAAVHAHIPSLAPLFVLGACFTLAYEWSGSLLVSMTMHALFNSFTLLALAFPDTLDQ